MSGLSGLIYPGGVNAVFKEAQTFFIFSSFSHRRIAVLLMGKVFEMPTFVLCLCSSIVQIRRHSLQTLSLVESSVLLTARTVQQTTVSVASTSSTSNSSTSP